MTKHLIQPTAFISMLSPFVSTQQALVLMSEGYRQEGVIITNGRDTFHVGSASPQYDCYVLLRSPIAYHASRKIASSVYAGVRKAYPSIQMTKSSQMVLHGGDLSLNSIYYSVAYMTFIPDKNFGGVCIHVRPLETDFNIGVYPSHRPIEIASSHAFLVDPAQFHYRTDKIIAVTHPNVYEQIRLVTSRRLLKRNTLRTLEASTCCTEPIPLRELFSTMLCSVQSFQQRDIVVRNHSLINRLAPSGFYTAHATQVYTGWDWPQRLPVSERVHLTNGEIPDSKVAVLIYTPRHLEVAFECSICLGHHAHGIQRFNCPHLVCLDCDNANARLAKCPMCRQKDYYPTSFVTNAAAHILPLPFDGECVRFIREIIPDGIFVNYFQNKDFCPTVINQFLARLGYPIIPLLSRTETQEGVYFVYMPQIRSWHVVSIGRNAIRRTYLTNPYQHPYWAAGEPAGAPLPAGTVVRRSRDNLSDRQSYLFSHDPAQDGCVGFGMFFYLWKYTGAYGFISRLAKWGLQMGQEAVRYYNEHRHIALASENAALVTLMQPQLAHADLIRALAAFNIVPVENFNEEYDPETPGIQLIMRGDGGYHLVAVMHSTALDGRLPAYTAPGYDMFPSSHLSFAVPFGAEALTYDLTTLLGKALPMKSLDTKALWKGGPNEDTIALIAVLSNLFQDLEVTYDVVRRSLGATTEVYSGVRTKFPIAVVKFTIDSDDLCMFASYSIQDKPGHKRERAGAFAFDCLSRSSSAPICEWALLICKKPGCRFRHFANPALAFAAINAGDQPPMKMDHVLRAHPVEEAKVAEPKNKLAQVVMSGYLPMIRPRETLSCEGLTVRPEGVFVDENRVSTAVLAVDGNMRFMDHNGVQSINDAKCHNDIVFVKADAGITPTQYITALVNQYLDVEAPAVAKLLVQAGVKETLGVEEKTMNYIMLKMNLTILSTECKTQIHNMILRRQTDEKEREELAQKRAPFEAALKSLQELTLDEARSIEVRYLKTIYGHTVFTALKTPALNFMLFLFVQTWVSLLAFLISAIIGFHSANWHYKRYRAYYLDVAFHPTVRLRRLEEPQLRKVVYQALSGISLLQTISGYIGIFYEFMSREASRHQNDYLQKLVEVYNPYGLGMAYTVAIYAFYIASSYYIWTVVSSHLAQVLHWWKRFTWDLMFLAPYVDVRTSTVDPDEPTLDTGLFQCVEKEHRRAVDEREQLRRAVLSSSMIVAGTARPLGPRDDHDMPESKMIALTHGNGALRNLRFYNQDSKEVTLDSLKNELIKNVEPHKSVGRQRLDNIRNQPAIARKSNYNTLIALMGRLGSNFNQYFTDPAGHFTQQQQDYFDWLSVETREFVKKFKDTVPLMQAAEYIQHVEPCKRQLYRQGLKSLSEFHTPNYTFEFMVKTNEVQCEKEPAKNKARGLFNPPQMSKFIAGLLGHNFTNLVKESPHCALGLNLKEVATRLQEMRSKYVDAHFISIDVSNFDSSQSATLRSHVDSVLIKEFFNDLYIRLDLPASFYEYALKIIGDMDVRFKAYRNGRGRNLLVSGICHGLTYSGHYTATSCGNTLRSMLNCKWLLQDIPGDYLCAGDDIVLVVSSAHIREITERLKTCTSRTNAGTSLFGYEVKKADISKESLIYLSRYFWVDHAGVVHGTRLSNRVYTGSVWTTSKLDPKEVNGAITDDLALWGGYHAGLRMYIDFRRTKIPSKPSGMKIIENRYSLEGTTTGLDEKALFRFYLNQASKDPAMTVLSWLGDIQYRSDELYNLFTMNEAHCLDYVTSR
jgi:hypothetical protein